MFYFFFAAQAVNLSGAPWGLLTNKRHPKWIQPRGRRQCRAYQLFLCSFVEKKRGETSGEALPVVRYGPYNDSTIPNPRIIEVGKDLQAHLLQPAPYHPWLKHVPITKPLNHDPVICLRLIHAGNWANLTKAGTFTPLPKGR